MRTDAAATSSAAPGPRRCGVSAAPRAATATTARPSSRRAGAAPARALWIGPGAARALHGDGVVELALHPGGYVRLGEEYALLAHPRAPRGPLTVLVAGLDAAPLQPGDPAHVGCAPQPGGGAPRAELAPADDPAHVGCAARSGGGAPPAELAPAGVLFVGPHEIGLSVTPAAQRPPTPLCPGWRAALTAALEAAPGPPRELALGLAALRAGDADAAVAELAGRGPGLTPAGDDVLAGYAAWRHAGGRYDDAAGRRRASLKGSAPVISALAAGRASPIGLAYLRCAERGELPEPAERVRRAIRAGDAPAARRAARALTSWGASSGAAILWGLASAT
jgi:hypothetical protein